MVAKSIKLLLATFTSFWFLNWPLGGEIFIGCHFHCQILAAHCSADDVAIWVAMLGAWVYVTMWNAAGELTVSGREDGGQYRNCLLNFAVRFGNENASHKSIREVPYLQ
jgi:hypothetical protein